MSTPESDAWQGRLLSIGCDFAEQCAQLRASNPFNEPALESMMVLVATELWDRRFSQSEIRSALETAITQLEPYAAGEERRGDRR